MFVESHGPQLTADPLWQSRRRCSSRWTPLQYPPLSSKMEVKNKYILWKCYHKWL